MVNVCGIACRIDRGGVHPLYSGYTGWSSSGSESDNSNCLRARGVYDAYEVRLMGQGKRFSMS